MQSNRAKGVTRPAAIGGDFPIPLSIFGLAGRKRNNFSNGEILLSTGRDCLDYIVKSLNPAKNLAVLLPSYLCHEMLVPFKKNHIRTTYYRVDGNLEIDVVDFNAQIEGGDIYAALIINYFGFIQPCRDEIGRICKNWGIFLIEDAVHSFLSEVQPIGDAVFNSLRKATCLPEGAVLKIRYGQQSSLDGVDNESNNTLKRVQRRYSPLHVLLVLLRMFAGLLDNARLLKPISWRLFLLSEKRLINLCSRPAGMSSISRRILKRMNFHSIKTARKNNYLYLLEKLRNLKKVEPLYKRLPTDIVPLGFPILCRNRERIRLLFKRNRIYSPIHWPMAMVAGMDKPAFKESYELSRKILTIPIDQRYGRKDMDRIYTLLLSEDLKEEKEERSKPV